MLYNLSDLLHAKETDLFRLLPFFETRTIACSKGSCFYVHKYFPEVKTERTKYFYCLFFLLFFSEMICFLLQQGINFMDKATTQLLSAFRSY